MKVICVSGNPGTGKTTLSKKLSKSLKYEYIDVNEIIKKYKLSEGYDEENKCEIIDVKKLNKVLVEIIKKTKKILIIDSHLSHYLAKKYVGSCIITACDIGILKDRLKKRKYDAKKIKDNIESEIFDNILIEAKEKNHNILIVNTSEGYKLKEIVDYIKSLNL
jgi:adenylate kinase